jgi:hypothetical protein
MLRYTRELSSIGNVYACDVWTAAEPTIYQLGFTFSVWCTANFHRKWQGIIVSCVQYEYSIVVKWKNSRIHRLWHNSDIFISPQRCDQKLGACYAHEFTHKGESNEILTDSLPTDYYSSVIFQHYHITGCVCSEAGSEWDKHRFMALGILLSHRVWRSSTAHLTWLSQKNCGWWRKTTYIFEFSVKSSIMKR